MWGWIDDDDNNYYNYNYQPPTSTKCAPTSTSYKRGYNSTFMGYNTMPFVEVITLYHNW